MRIAIDYGHTLSGADTGAVGNGLREQDITRAVGKRVTAKLRALGHTVIEVAVDSASSVGQSLSHRTTVANDAGVDLFVSLHVNAGGGNGAEVYTYQGNSFSYASNVLSNICSLGFRNRGIKNGSNLYVIRNAKAKAMLVEMFFIDTGDSSTYKHLGAERMATAIVKGLTGQTAPSTPNKPVQNAPQSSKHPLVQQLDAETRRQGFNSYPMCRQGARGGITKTLQQMLINIGYPVGSYGADGVFGGGTVTAVKAIQKDCGLSADGIVGTNTWNVIIRNLK